MVSRGKTLSSDLRNPRVFSSGEDSGAEPHALQDSSGSEDSGTRGASLADGGLQRQADEGLGRTGGTAWRKTPEQSRFPFIALLPPPSLGPTKGWPVKLQISNAGENLFVELRSLSQDIAGE